VITYLTQLFVTAPALLYTLAAVAALAAIAVSVVVGRRLATVVRRIGAGRVACYGVAMLCTGLSIDTSWKFFTERLGITNVWERGALFAIIEAGLISCAIVMSANIRSGGTPGFARTLAWSLTGFAGYMALVEAGPVLGMARVVLGPILGLVMLHMALGIEVREIAPARRGAVAQLARELQARVMSRFGLADDDRTAAERTRHRWATRAAQLACASPSTVRHHSVKLAKAVRKAGAAHDAQARERLLREISVLRHATALVTYTPPSPWESHGVPTSVPTSSHETVPIRSHGIPTGVPTDSHETTDPIGLTAVPTSAVPIRSHERSHEIPTNGVPTGPHSFPRDSHGRSHGIPTSSHGAAPTDSHEFPRNSQEQTPAVPTERRRRTVPQYAEEVRRVRAGGSKISPQDVIELTRCSKNTATKVVRLLVGEGYIATT
jgi:hypothetical protein